MLRRRLIWLCEAHIENNEPDIELIIFNHQFLFFSDLQDVFGDRTPYPLGESICSQFSFY